MTVPFPFRLYLVVSSESTLGRPLEQLVVQAVMGGVDLVQLREKGIPTPLFLERALRLREVLDRYGVPLIINDNLEVAMAVQAHGIHVGNSDVAPSYIKAKWPECKGLGRSVEYLGQLRDKETQLADCLGISPVFRTPTKTDTITEWGLHGLAKIRGMTDKPLVAIGNMNATNAQEVIRAGADCLAVVSAICHAPDPQRAAFGIREQIEKAL